MQGQTSSYVITTLVTPPASSGLTTLADVKLELDITDTSNDIWLTKAIARASDQIARHCNRIFGLATWQDEFRPQRGLWGEGVQGANNPLIPPRWPLVSVTSVVETVAGIATTLVEGTDFEVDAGSLLPADEGVGRLYRLNEQGNPRTWPAAMIVVVYTAGYALPNDEDPNLPGDLQEATLLLLTQRWHGAGRDPTLRELNRGAGLGGETYWVGGPPNSGALPRNIEDMLDRYRVPVVA